MPASLNLASPAKVNLTLTVLGKRPDGFHEIETLFERIDLCDRIQIKKTKGPIQFLTRSPQIPKGQENLVFKAATLLKDQYHVPCGADIFLEKIIPVGAGLGGGSSNAATVLTGLNRLWNLGLTHKELLSLGARLGSDVPFFILNTSFAIGTGRGEKLKVISLKNVRLWHCIVKPPFSISTKDAYGSLKSTALIQPLHARAGLTPQNGNARMLVRSLRKSKVFEAKNLLNNTLEQALNKRVRSIFEIKKKLLDSGALASLMSGSGSSVFGIFQTKLAAERAAKTLRENNKLWQVFVASTF